MIFDTEYMMNELSLSDSSPGNENKNREATPGVTFLMSGIGLPDSSTENDYAGRRPFEPLTLEPSVIKGSMWNRSQKRSLGSLLEFQENQSKRMQLEEESPLFELLRNPTC